VLQQNVSTEDLSGEPGSSVSSLVRQDDFSNRSASAQLVRIENTSLHQVTVFSSPDFVSQQIAAVDAALSNRLPKTSHTDSSAERVQALDDLLANRLFDKSDKLDDELDELAGQAKLDDVWEVAFASIADTDDWQLWS